MYRRDTVSASYEQVVLSSYPNTILYFGSGSELEALSASTFYITTSHAIFAETASYMQGFIDSASYSSYAVTASYALNGGTGGSASISSSYSLTSSYALNGGGVSDTASYSLTASYIGEGITGFIPQWIGNNELSSTGSISITEDEFGQYVRINSASANDPNAPEALLVKQLNPTSYNLMGGYGDVDNYFQINIKNISTGSVASGDIVVTSNDGNEISHYIDMGINSTGYSVPAYDITSAGDGYVLIEGGNLAIGTRTNGNVVKIHTGGSTAADERIRVENEQTKILNNLSATGSILGSLEGTSSWAINSQTSSFSEASNTASFVIGSNVSGSVLLSNSASYIVPGATFYLASGSNGVPAAYIEPYDYSPVDQIYQPPYKAGRMFWDNRYNDWAWYAATGSGATSWRSHLGKEISITVHNPYSVTLPRLSVVYVGTSSVAGAYYPDVYLAIADGTNTKSTILGVIRNDIPSGSTGFCLTNGAMHRTNMGSFQIGDKLWLSTTTPGGMTSTQPGQPNEQVLVGYCSETGVLGSFIMRQSTIPTPASAYAGITSTVLIDNTLNNGTIVVSTGSVNLYSDSTGYGSVTGYPLQSKTLTLTTGSTNYVVAERSGSAAAQYTITTDSTYANGVSIVRVATLDINYKGPGNWDIHEFDIGIVGLALANRMNNRDIRLFGYRRESGLVLSETGSRGINITEGNVWYGPNSHVIPDYSTTYPGFYIYHFHHSGSGWSQISENKYDNGFYDDGTGPQPIGPGMYTVNYIYRLMGTEDEAALLLGSAPFSSSLEAQNNSQPTPNPPSTITDIGLLVGRIIVQSGSNTAAVIESAFANQFAAASVTTHNSLQGLQGGQGGEYYHLTQADYTGTGNGLIVRQNQPTLNNPVFVAATPYHIPYWDTAGHLTLTGSVQVYQEQYVIINSASVTIDNPEALLVKQVNTSSANTIGAYSEVNNYSQIYNQNYSSGSEASTDFCATADVGDQESNYIDMGVGSSTYNDSRWPWVKPLDGYVQMAGGDLWLATTTNNVIKFAINNTASVGYIDFNGIHVSGSLIGTSSWANTSSYSLLSNTASYITGGLFRLGVYYPTSSTDVANKQYVDDSVLTPNNSVFDIEYNFKSSTITGDPGPGNFKYNSATTSSITNIWIDPITRTGLDFSKVISQLKGDTKIYIQQRTDSSKASLFSLSGSVVDNGGWYTIPVNHEASAAGGIPTADATCIFVFLNQNYINSGSTYQITSSWANRAVSSSYFSGSIVGSVTSASYALTASYSLNGGSTGTTLTTGSFYPITSSWSNYSLISINSLYASASNVATSTINASSSVVSLSSLFASQSLFSTSSLSSSWASSSLSSSYILASNLPAHTASWANFALVSTNALYASSSTVSTTSNYASSSNVAISAVNASSSIVSIFSQFASSSLFASSSISSSWASSSLSASYYNQLWLVTGSLYPITSSYSLTSSYITSSKVVGSVATASYSYTASYFGLPIKSGIVTSQSFGGNPRTASVIFTKPFVDNNYTITVTGESARTWLIQGKASGSFRISSNAATPITGSTFWQAIYQGEYN
jgi:hypothetical protein